MDEISRTLRQLWDTKPGAVVLLLVGIVVFLFLVFDTWRHKKNHPRH